MTPVPTTDAVDAAATATRTPRPRRPAAEAAPAGGERGFRRARAWPRATRTLDQPSPSAAAAAAPTAPSARAGGDGEPTSTEIVVKGLGSFGAITGFRQALASVDGIDSVALSLGQTGRVRLPRHATRPASTFVAAIASLEGEGAKIEHRPEGGLRVTLDRAR